MKQRTIIEYRVLSTRTGGIVTDKRYGSLKAVSDRIGRLTSGEPWRFYGDALDRDRRPDDYACCEGYQCGCGGQTLRAKADEERAQYPSIESITVQMRRVTRTEWEDIEARRVIERFGRQVDAISGEVLR